LPQISQNIPVISPILSRILYIIIAVQSELTEILAEKFKIERIPTLMKNIRRRTLPIIMVAVVIISFAMPVAAGAVSLRGCATSLDFDGAIASRWQIAECCHVESADDNEVHGGTITCSRYGCDIRFVWVIMPNGARILGQQCMRCGWLFI
jgi:hypothetical protein